MPHHIQFVWHGINDMANLTQFLASEVHWGEFDVRMDPIYGDLILRHDSFEKTPIQKDETWVPLDQALDRIGHRKKGIKLDLKAGGLVVDRTLDTIATYDIDDSNLWFNGEIATLHQRGFRRLVEAHSDAIIQCPVDFLAPLISATPAKAKEILDMFSSWGINRFSISWHTLQIRHFFDQMDQWGYEVNIYNIPDLEGFLQAVLLMPQSPRILIFQNGTTLAEGQEKEEAMQMTTAVLTLPYPEDLILTLKKSRTNLRLKPGFY